MSIPPGSSDPLADTSDVPPEGKAGILACATAAIDAGDLDQARHVLRTEYPVTPAAKTARRYTERQSLHIFYRDGFLDRYSGTKLVASRAPSGRCRCSCRRNSPSIRTGRCRSPTSRSGSCSPPSIIRCRSPGAAPTRSRTG
ncbi:hypothetical protein ACFQZK_17645 [Rhodococcus aetherivorans]